MCMQDINIDRQTKTNVYVAATSVAIPANPNRLSIRISCDDTGRGILSLKTPTQRLGSGATAVSVVPILFVYRNDAGTPQPPIPSATVTLAEIGDAFKGDLILNSDTLVNAYAVETYLDVNDGIPLDVTKLP